MDYMEGHIQDSIFQLNQYVKAKEEATLKRPKPKTHATDQS